VVVDLIIEALKIVDMIIAVVAHLLGEANLVTVLDLVIDILKLVIHHLIIEEMNIVISQIVIFLIVISQIVIGHNLALDIIPQVTRLHTLEMTQEVDYLFPETYLEIILEIYQEIFLGIFQEERMMIEGL
jgi:hypothetical protein